MKIPEGFLDTDGKIAKGEVVIVAGEERKHLKEFRIKREDDTTTCYVLTSPGDVLAASFALNPSIADRADIVVDGVLRSSVSNSKPLKLFRALVEKVCYQPTNASGRRGAAKYCKMQVKERSTKRDVITHGDDPASEVGSIKIQLFRRDQDADPADPLAGGGAFSALDQASATNENSAPRAPAFNKFAEWSDLNCIVDSEKPPSPFEMEFIDRKEPSKAIKDRVLKELSPDYKIWATFVFRLSSTADLRRLGIECPTYYSTSKLSPDQGVLKDDDNASVKDAYEDLFEETPKPTDVKPKGSVRKKIEPSDNGAAETEATRTIFKTHQAAGSQQTIAGALSLMSKSNGNKQQIIHEDAPQDSLTTSAGREEVLEGAKAGDNDHEDSASTQDTKSERSVIVDDAMDQEQSSSSLLPKTSSPFQGALISELSQEGRTMKLEFVESAPFTQQPFTPKKQIALPGVKGAPAYRSFLQGEAARASAVRSSTPMGEGNSRLDEFSQNEAVLGGRRDSCPPEALVTMAGSRSHISNSQGEFPSPAWSPLTPPATYRKQHTRQPQHGGPISFRGFGISGDYSQKPLVQTDSAKSDEYGNLYGEKIPILLGEARATSEAFSDATEVAAPEDIDRIVRDSHRANPTNSYRFSQEHPRAGPFQEATFKSEPMDYEAANHTFPSPILGKSMSTGLISTSQAFTVDTEGQGSSSQMVKQHWQHHSATPSPAFVSSMVFQPSLKGTSMFPVVADPEPKQAFKRKLDTMTGTDLPELDSPRKTPALVSQQFGGDREAAEARIVAAKTKREELQRRLEAAREVKARTDQIKELNQKAADVERDNAKMEEEIAAIYRMDPR